MEASVEPRHPHLICDCLVQIFTFLGDQDLIIASSVCQDWHEAAETPWLWRMLCLRRWSFCNFAAMGAERGAPSWKRYFLRRRHLEAKMTSGRSGGYACKSLRGHAGSVVGLAYLQLVSAHLPHLWNTSATVCSASTDGTVRAWNIQSGQLLWCSETQSPLTEVVCDEKREVVITADSTGLVKTWQGHSGQELASFATSSPQCTLLQYNINDSWFLTVGTNLGSLCTLADSTNLTKRSSVKVCDTFKVNILGVSPDRKYIMAGTKDNDDSSPKAICTDSLTSPAEDEEALCQFLPVTGCQAAVFIPTQPARVAAIHHSGRTSVLSVFDISTKKKTRYKSEIQMQQVESFDLSLSTRSQEILLEAKDSNCLVLAADQELRVYSMRGALLATFRDHALPISSICVDCFRVVTASRDLSLRVLTWGSDGERSLNTLESRYHLLGGSHTMSSGFTHVACDYSSIVAVAEGRDGKDVLKAYSFAC